MDLKKRLMLLDKLETALLEIEGGIHEMKDAVKEIREDCREELSKEEVGSK